MVKALKKIVAVAIMAALVTTGTAFTPQADIVWGESEIETSDVYEGIQIVFQDDEEFTYTGSEIKPLVDVSDNGEILVENEDYVISYTNNINAGAACVDISGIGTYEGIISSALSFEILPKDISDGDIEVDDSNLLTFDFNGKDRTPIILLSYNGVMLDVMKDYEVEYSDNFYPGTATVTLTGIDNFTGSIQRQFKITKKNIKDVTIRTSFDSAGALVVTVNNGSYAMTKGVDYDYSVVTDSTGKITITFTGMGSNYTGTYVVEISAEDNPNKPEETTAKVIKVKKVKLNTIKNKKGKKIKLTWKKAPNAEGYQIQYSTGKKFKKPKTALKTIKKNKTKGVIAKLKKNTKYFVRIRAYRVVKNKTYYGEWSKAKSISIEK